MLSLMFIVEKYLIGVFQTQWTNSGVSSFLETLSLIMAIRRSITLIKAHNIPAPNILKYLKNMIFKYLWTVKEEPWITFILNASGRKSLKYEKIYLNPPNGGLDLYQMITEYIEFYNTKRR